jgi:transposase-like protein
MSSRNNGQHHAPEIPLGRNGSSASDREAPKNGNGRKTLSSTIPLVESQERASTKPRNTVKAKSRAASPRAEPTDEASTADVVDEVVTSSAIEAVQRIRGQLGPPRLDWPVEAQRRGERLKLKQTSAVDLLASGMTISEAARQLGVDRSTIHRWLNDSVFLSELEDRRQELVESMLDQHLLAGRMATAKLMESMESSQEGIALRAAIELYRGSQRAYHSIDVRKRIERLEDNLGLIYGWRR